MKNSKHKRLLASLAALISLFLFTGTSPSENGCSECDDLFETKNCTIRIVNYQDVETTSETITVTLFNSNNTVITEGADSEFKTVYFSPRSSDIKEINMLAGYIVWEAYRIDVNERKTIAAGTITIEKGETKTIHIR